VVNLAALSADPFCALIVAMVRSCCATNQFDRNRSPRRNPRVCSTRDKGHNAFLFQVGTCSSHIRLWNYGITAECGVDKSVNTSAVHVWTSCETKSKCKNAKCDACTFFLWHKQSQSASRRSARKLDAS